VHDSLQKYKHHCCCWRPSACFFCDVLWSGFSPVEAAPLLRDFGGRWKVSIEAMHREVTEQVTDQGCAREVLQVRYCSSPADGALSGSVHSVDCGRWLRLVPLVVWASLAGLKRSSG